MASKSPLVIEMEGMEELQEALEEFHDDWKPIASRAMTPGLATLESGVKEEARHDTGQTAASVGSKIERTLGSEIVGKVGSNVAHASYALEHGRGPGGMPPVSLIEEWAGRHGMAGAGWAIAKTIAVRGVKAPKTMSNVARSKATEVVKKFEQGIDAELRRLGLKD